MAMTPFSEAGFVPPDRIDRGGVAAMTLAVAAVMTAELMPVGLLTLIAKDLHLSTGAAGQAVTATAIAGVVTSISIASVTRVLDRRSVILGIAALLVVSDLVVAFSHSLPMLLFGRILVGVAHGGLWALVPACAIRLAPPDRVPRVMAIIFAGISAAITLATPLGSFLGESVGWRGAFLMAAGVALVSGGLLFARLPRMATAPEAKGAYPALPLRLLGEPYLAIGMAAVVMVFAGHYALFTYVRPFVEGLPGVGRGSLPLLLFLYGAANFVGVTLAGRFLATNLFRALALPPLAMALMATALISLGKLPVLASVVLVAWGFVYGMVPVGWNVWVARTNAARAEGAGGLLVACIQSGIALGAAIGGGAYDRGGYPAAFGLSAAILLATACAAVAAGRSWHRAAVSRGGVGKVR